MAGLGNSPEARAGAGGARAGLRAGNLALRIAVAPARIAATAPAKAVIWKWLLGGFLFLAILAAILPNSFFRAESAAAYPQGSGIPRVYWPIYEAAAGHYGVNPYLLASIHMQESRFSGQLSNPPAPAQGVASGVNSFGCCAGPMQFNLSNTWAGHKDGFLPIASARPSEYPLDRRRLPSCRGVPDDDGCVYDDFDAIAAAAHKLSADGADLSLTSPGTHEAVCRYIGDCAEVDQCREVAPDQPSPNQYCQVLPRAIEWEQMGAAAVLIQSGVGQGELAWPTPAHYRTITSGFGMRWGRPHSGIDIDLVTGTPVMAAAFGQITHVCQDVPPCSGYGNFVCIQHAPDRSTCYAHLDGFAPGVREGASVGRGEVIGYGGNTGHSFGSHLHFEVRLGRYPAEAVDPQPFLEPASGAAA